MDEIQHLPSTTRPKMPLSEQIQPADCGTRSAARRVWPAAVAHPVPGTHHQAP